MLLALLVGLLTSAPDAGYTWTGKGLRTAGAKLYLFEDVGREIGWINQGDCVLRYADDATADEKAWVRVQWSAHCKQNPESKCCTE